MVKREHMDMLKNGCIVANMGHSYCEIDVASLQGLKREKIRQQVCVCVCDGGERVLFLLEMCYLWVWYLLFDLIVGDADNLA